MGLHSIDARQRAFGALDGEAATFQVNVGALKHADLGSPQAVAVGGEKNRAVAFGFNRGEKPLGFLLGEEGDNSLLGSDRGPGDFFHTR